MKRLTSHRIALALLIPALAIALPGCGKKEKAEPMQHGEHAQHREHAPAAHEKHGGHATAAPAGQKMEGMVEGFTDRMAVQINAEQRQLINIRTAPARRQKLSKTIRTVGIVTYDTSRLVDVNTKINGWAEVLYVDKPGQFVRKGEPLMDIYSPELYSGQQEYLLSYRQYQRLKSRQAAAEAPAQFWQENLKEAESLVESARKRLRLWDISDAAIRALEESGKPSDTLKMTSPVTGFVVLKRMDPGQAVHAGMTLYRVADLSTVWVNADIYEYELPLVKVGQEAHVTLTAYPDRDCQGRVDFIYPYLETKTRTATVRLVMPNADGLLKPDMYANVEIKVDLGEPLVVPADAAFDTGLRQYVFVQTGEGRYAPRLVKLGVRSEDLFIVRDGLKEGEWVVVDGNFLLDSESQLKASGMTGHQH